MKVIAIILAVSVAVILGSLLYQTQQSHSGSAPGLSDNMLSECPDKPNCVCSEYRDDPNQYIPAIQLADMNSAMDTARAVIDSMGGSVTLVDGDYLASTFTSKVFRFVDDFELRLDREASELQIRSGARLGYSDMDANRHRAEQFRAAFQAATSTKTSTATAR